MGFRQYSYTIKEIALACDISEDYVRQLKKRYSVDFSDIEETVRFIEFCRYKKRYNKDTDNA